MLACSAAIWSGGSIYFFYFHCFADIPQPMLCITTHVFKSGTLFYICLITIVKISIPKLGSEWVAKNTKIHDGQWWFKVTVGRNKKMNAWVAYNKIINKRWVIFWSCVFINKKENKLKSTKHATQTGPDFHSHTLARMRAEILQKKNCVPTN